MIKTDMEPTFFDKMKRVGRKAAIPVIGGLLTFGARDAVHANNPVDIEPGPQGDPNALVTQSQVDTRSPIEIQQDQDPVAPEVALAIIVGDVQVIPNIMEISSDDPLNESLTELKNLLTTRTQNPMLSPEIYREMLPNDLTKDSVVLKVVDASGMTEYYWLNPNPDISKNEVKFKQLTNPKAIGISLLDSRTDVSAPTSRNIRQLPTKNGTLVDTVGSKELVAQQGQDIVTADGFLWIAVTWTNMDGSKGEGWISYDGNVTTKSEDPKVLAAEFQGNIYDPVKEGYDRVTLDMLNQRQNRDKFTSGYIAAYGNAAFPFQYDNTEDPANNDYSGEWVYTYGDATHGPDKRVSQQYSTKLVTYDPVTRMGTARTHTGEVIIVDMSGEVALYFTYLDKSGVPLKDPQKGGGKAVQVFTVPTGVPLQAFQKEDVISVSYGYNDGPNGKWAKDLAWQGNKFIVQEVYFGGVLPELAVSSQ